MDRMYVTLETSGNHAFTPLQHPFGHAIVIVVPAFLGTLKEGKEADEAQFQYRKREHAFAFLPRCYPIGRRSRLARFHDGSKVSANWTPRLMVSCPYLYRCS